MEKKSSNLKKAGTIFFTLLVLLIPVGFLFGIISDRQDYKNKAVAAIASSWAGEQVIDAPDMSFQQKEGKEFVTKNLILNNYNVDINVNTEIRKKGIFKVPVYTADVKLSGDFLNNFGNLADKQIETSISVSDSTGFITEPVFKINNSLAKISHNVKYSSNINSKSEVIPFEISYKIRGLNEIYVSPDGQNNNIKISGNWKDPSFEGDFLPKTRNVDNQKFFAQWSIPAIATSSLQGPKAKAGVSLLMPVDNYRMTERALKYAFLFLALTFLSYFVFEVQSKDNKKIHPLQYCLLGGAMLIFYLLLVSLSEFLPFLMSYIIAAFMIVSLVSAYTYFVITKKQNLRFSVIISSLMVILYSFLYVLLSLQDLGLLVGSLGLFAIIAAIMYITRNIDWYNCD